MAVLSSMSRRVSWKRISPWLLSSLSRARPRVDLPEPDSPTMPTVWPRRMLTSMPRTASKYSLGPNRRFLRAKRTRMSLASSTMGSLSATGALRPRGSASISMRVYSWRGLAKTSRVSPCSTSSPWRITQTRSAKCLTMVRSWVMNRIAMP